MSTLSNLTPSSRLWIFPFTEQASSSQVEAIAAQLDSFFEDWNAHGASVKGAFEFFENRFLVVAADESDVQASGCSIDSLVAHVQSALAEIKLSLADFSDVFFREKSKVSHCDRVSFAKLVSDGQVDSNTRVFDISLQQLQPYLEGKMEQFFSNSWHSKAFPLPA